MPRDVHIRFGPPGTGKTTSLLNEVHGYLDAGIRPDRIAFCSFTRHAAEVARKGATEKYGLKSDELVHFRTLHSMAYRQLELKPQEVMDTADYQTVAEAVGLPLSGSYDYETERVSPGGALGDACLRLYALSRARCTTIEEEWSLADERELQLKSVQQFTATLAAFKAERKVLDFTDMVDLADTPLDVDVFIVDEAQDLTLAQWNLARRMAQHARTIWIAGDDDQSLYDWAGASSSTLMRLQGQRIVLPHSYRLPIRVKALADRVAQQIRYRVPKTYTSRADEGSVEWISEPDQADLRSSSSWLLLGRHRHQLKRLAQAARAQGVVYRLNGLWSNEAPYVKAAMLFERLRKGQTVTRDDAQLVAQHIVDMPLPQDRDSYTWANLPWPWATSWTPSDWMQGLTRLTPDELEYIRQLRRNGESLHKPGRVVIDTIHGAKGGEADNVLLLTDVSARVQQGMQDNPDAEHRVWYVGVSRARENLFLVFPSTPRFWSLQ